ncbi:MAG: YfhO family protein [Myxococcales bacterium]|nr:YfhO family protein [Myxococcales bacterium]
MSKLRWLLPLRMPLVYTLLTMAVFWRLWTPIDGAERSWKHDPQHEYWGDLIFQQDTLADGQLALWNPHDRGGFPVYGDPQPGMFYPPNWALLAWGSFGDSLPFGIASFKIVLHWIFGAIGMHLLIRRLGGSRESWEPACYAAGALFSFTSPKLRYMGSALNWSVAWLPWVLLSVWYFSEKPTARRGVFMGTALAMVLLSGAPAALLYALILALPLGLYKMWGRIREHWKPIAIAALTSLFWVLPLMASNLEQLPESVRQTRSYSFITDSVFSPGHLISFVVPRLGQGENPYVGGLVLLAIGLAIANRKQRGLAWVFLGVAAFSIAISMGGHAGFLPSLASAFSPFSMFRRAHRYLYITSLALAVLGGLGLGYVLSLEVEARKAQLAKVVSLVGGALSFATGMAYLMSVVMQEKIGANKNEGFGIAFLSALVFTVLIRLILTSPPKAKRGLAWAVVALLFVDIWTANFHVSDVGMTALPLTPRDGDVAKLEAVERDWRIYDDGYLQFRPGTRLGIRDFSGYEDDPLGLSRYTKLLVAAKRNHKLFGHANVRYLLTRKGKLKPKTEDAKAIAPGIWELNQSAPAVYFVPAPLLAKDSTDALKRLRTFAPGTNAVVEGKFTAGDASLPITIGRITTLEPNRVVAEIETPGPGLVVIAEAYYPKWEATVDGTAARILPANLMFRGIPVSGPGTHRIEMTLSPGSFWWFLPAYLLAFVGLLWAALWPSFRRRWT